jgi:quercetin dioxygenase-like cupin family protein
MLIQRWQASHSPLKNHLKMMLTLEGLEFIEEAYAPNEKVKEHRHPLTEVRIVVEGEMLFHVGSNQFVLRAGDRVEIPPNTKHSHATFGEIPCISLFAEKI